MRVKSHLLCLLMITAWCGLLYSQKTPQNISPLVYDEIKVYGLPKSVSTRLPVKIENISELCSWRISKDYDYLKILDDTTESFLERIAATKENDGFIRIRIDFLYEDKIIKQYGIDKNSYDELMTYIQTLLLTD